MNTNTLIAAESLASFALREVVLSGSLASRVADSPDVLNGNLRNQPTAIFVNPRDSEFHVVYSVNQRALDLFKLQSPLLRHFRLTWREYGRGYVAVRLTPALPVIVDADFTVRACRELLCPFRAPLTATEARTLNRLFSNPAAAPFSVDQGLVGGVEGPRL